MGSAGATAAGEPTCLSHATSRGRRPLAVAAKTVATCWFGCYLFCTLLQVSSLPPLATLLAACFAACFRCRCFAVLVWSRREWSIPIAVVSANRHIPTNFPNVSQGVCRASVQVVSEMNNRPIAMPLRLPCWVMGLLGEAGRRWKSRPRIVALLGIADTRLEALHRQDTTLEVLTGFERIERELHLALHMEMLHHATHFYCPPPARSHWGVGRLVLSPNNCLTTSHFLFDLPIFFQKAGCDGPILTSV